MIKYFYGFKLNLLHSLNYRFNTFIGLLFGNLRLLIVIFFWNLIYGGDMRKTLNGFTLPGMVTYLIVIDVLGTLAFVMRGSGFDYSALIKNGALGPSILKPRNLGVDIYFRNLSAGISALLPQAAVVAALLPLIGRFLVWDINPAGTAYIAFFMLSGTITGHLLCSLLGYMAFWLEESNAVMWSFAVLLNFSMGFFLPLDFFPGWLAPVLEIMPFASWGYIQTKVFIGLYPAEKLAPLLAVQAAWICVLLPLNALVWNRGVRRFSSVGG